jgi:TonB family protein
MIAPHKNSPVVLLSILICLLISPAALRAQGQSDDRGQVSMTRTPESAPVLSDRAKRQLQDKLRSSLATPLQIIDVEGAPLEINGAKAQSIEIEGNYDAPTAPVAMINDHVAVAMINDHVANLNFRLVNRSDRPITGTVLEFTNTQENNTFYVYATQEEITGGKTVPMNINVGESKKFRIPFIVVTGDPAYLSVRLAGAKFGDGSTWGSFPFPQPRGSNATSRSATELNAQQVDIKPKLLNSPQPRYTEDARRNHVCGVVNLRLMVGVDGVVVRVNVTSALPDGLTEQAIRAVYEMKFEPARKSGEPVAYWMPVMIEFNLR